MREEIRIRVKTNKKHLIGEAKMIDELKLRLMKEKPTAADVASSNMSRDAQVAVRVALRRSCKEQKKIAKQSAKLLAK